MCAVNASPLSLRRDFIAQGVIATLDNALGNVQLAAGTLLKNGDDLARIDFGEFHNVSW